MIMTWDLLCRTTSWQKQFVPTFPIRWTISTLFRPYTRHEVHTYQDDAIEETQREIHDLDIDTSIAVLSLHPTRHDTDKHICPHLWNRKERNPYFVYVLVRVEIPHEMRSVR